jgi:hypothetical protein
MTDANCGREIVLAGEEPRIVEYLRASVEGYIRFSTVANYR